MIDFGFYIFYENIERGSTIKVFYGMHVLTAKNDSRKIN
jgi:hypothetical protein